MSGISWILGDPPGVDPFRELAASLAHMPAVGRSLSATVTFGLSDSAPDVGLSLGWIVAL